MNKFKANIYQLDDNKRYYWEVRLTNCNPEVPLFESVEDFETEDAAISNYNLVISAMGLNPGVYEWDKVV